MTQPIRILQILGIVAGGGVEAVIMNYYRHIDRTRVQFDFIVHKDSPVDIKEEVEAMGGRVYEVTPYYKNPIAFTLEIYRIIKGGHYEIVHSNMNTLSAFPLLAARLAGAKTRILHNHSTSAPGETKRNIAKSILKPFARSLATHYWACSRLAATWMYGKALVDSGRVTIIPNAIDLTRYAFDQRKRDTLRKDMHLTGRTVIGHVGRFMYQKNHPFLLEAFAKAHERNPGLALLLIGDGPLRPAMEEKATRLGIADSVHFLGLRNDVAGLYNAMDLFLLPSHYEGLPVVGVEAQANGLPCLVSTKVTREMQLTSSVTYKDLAEGPAAWAGEILSMQVQRNGDVKEEMRNAGFDIEEAAKTLAARYEALAAGVDTHVR